MPYKKVFRNAIKAIQEKREIKKFDNGKEIIDFIIREWESERCTIV